MRQTYRHKDGFCGFFKEKLLWLSIFKPQNHDFMPIWMLDGHDCVETTNKEKRYFTRYKLFEVRD